RTVEALPGDLEILQAAPGGVFLDQPVALHDVELQVAHRELLGQPDFRGAGYHRRTADCEDNHRAYDPRRSHRSLPRCFHFLLIRRLARNRRISQGLATWRARRCTAIALAALAQTAHQPLRIE